MNEVKKCSISGVGFTLNTDAYEALERYLESLKQTYRENPDGDEIIADIEARIAELILSTQDTARVVERPLIENIVHQLGSAEEISDTDPAGDRRGPRIPRRLYRDTETPSWAASARASANTSTSTPRGRGWRSFCRCCSPACRPSPCCAGSDPRWATSSASSSSAT